MPYLGDYKEDYADLNYKFTTRDSDGAPSTMTNGVVKVYKSNATDSETATGVTLSADFDGVTGLNNVKVDLSADAFYETGEDYAIVLTDGDVDSVDVTGEVLATFSIENRWDEADLTKIKGTGLTETEGQLAAGFKKFFDVETPVFTAESVNQSADNNTILANETYGLSALKSHGDSAWITATSVTVSDKAGFKLASDGLDAVTTWTVDITGSMSGNSTHDAADVKTAIEAAGSHLALILADTGTTIPAAIAALDVGAGSGAIEHDVTVLDPDDDPIGNVQVWVYTEEAMTNLVANGITDAFGVVTFYLDAGTYYVKCEKSKYNFDNPGTEEVTE